MFADSLPHKSCAPGAGQRPRASMTATKTVPPRASGASAVQADEAEPMDVECSVPPRLSEEDYAREIILAAYHRDAARVASVLQVCGPEATAEMSLSRAAAVQLLGEDVYLGSHSWSTQEGFPVMYFAGERTRASRSSAPFPARISPPRKRVSRNRGKAAVGNDSARGRRFFSTPLPRRNLGCAPRPDRSLALERPRTPPREPVRRPRGEPRAIFPARRPDTRVSEPPHVHLEKPRRYFRSIPRTVV